MRLLLDEHVDPKLAEQLRARGHDVVAVAEDAALRGSDDDALLDWAASNGRALATYDLGDLPRLAEERLLADLPFAGLIAIPAKSFPPGLRTHGRLLRALAAILDAHPARDALAQRVIWLHAE